MNGNLNFIKRIPTGYKVINIIKNRRISKIKRPQFKILIFILIIYQIVTNVNTIIPFIKIINIIILILCKKFWTVT